MAIHRKKYLNNPPEGMTYQKIQHFAFGCGSLYAKKSRPSQSLVCSSLLPVGI